MSAHQLITDHLDLWTQAVTQKSTAGRGSNGKVELTGIKKLRELILELAVRGKLVEQDAGNEPARKLLLKLYNENITASSNKKKTPEPIMDNAPTPYKAPQSWSWACLGDLFDIVYGKGLAKSELTDEGYDVFGANGIIGKYKKYTYEHPQLLISCRGAYSGKANISPTQCFITSNTLVLKNSWNYLNLKYFYYALTVADKSKIVTGSAQPQVTTANLSPFIVAVPPLEEQHRIVQKVDELMALCDRLEQHTSDQLDAHETLVDTLLGTLTQSANATELADNWARLAAHFDTLFTTEQSIDKLKQTILQQAVMGRLVEQDEGDEPVCTLRKHIAITKAKLIKSGALRKQKPIPALDKDKLPFTAPGSWEWVTFGEVTFNRDAERIPLSVSDRRTRSGEFDYYGASGIIDRIDDYLFDSPLLLIGEDGANLINRSTPIAFIARGKYWVNNHAHVLDGISENLLRYLCLYINATSLEPYVTGTAQPKMNQAKMNSIPVPLPPEEEQVRIVQKVDELMALCDHLKQRLNQASNTRNQLAGAVVEGALN